MDHEGAKPNAQTFIIRIEACSRLGSLDLKDARNIHSLVIHCGYHRHNEILTGLITMFSKCGILDDARRAFESHGERNVVTWTAMIAAYAQKGYLVLGLELFQTMEAEGILPDTAALASGISSCSSLEELRAMHQRLVAGRAIHRKLEGLHDVIFPAVVAALLNLYGRCGSLAEASALFNASHKRTVASWNAMIAAYAQHGHLPESLDLVHQMQLHGSLPDKFTYIEILQACSHSGTRNLGWSYFVRMGMDHGLIPAIEHYVCVVDLLGRIGQLELAERVVKGLPYEPDVAAWNSLLGSCKIQGDMPRAQDTVGAVLKLQAESAAPYVLLANLYAAARRWEDVAMVRKAMADRGIRKPTGRSFQCV
ncbi:hypothetical protein SELMODRAFT_106883 [Selaginella moellendorffii]|uniref:Pentacotripeptide-repeat region of PRORP domain-containing protein n=1 Tax=Selaginella moellendorffii TaxID=88036 RepID=D8S2L3_SELML|nr:hypothetical protein SELMODRAFT_106883 [Selaginella moellendorffii]